MTRASGIRRTPSRWDGHSAPFLSISCALIFFNNLITYCERALARSTLALYNNTVRRSLAFQFDNLQQKRSRLQRLNYSYERSLRLRRTIIVNSQRATRSFSLLLLPALPISVTILTISDVSSRRTHALCMCAYLLSSLDQTLCFDCWSCSLLCPPFATRRPINALDGRA